MSISYTIYVYEPDPIPELGDTFEVVKVLLKGAVMPVDAYACVVLEATQPDPKPALVPFDAIPADDLHRLAEHIAAIIEGRWADEAGPGSWEQVQIEEQEPV